MSCLINTRHLPQRLPVFCRRKIELWRWLSVRVQSEHYVQNHLAPRWRRKEERERGVCVNVLVENIYQHNSERADSRENISPLEKRACRRRRRKSPARFLGPIVFYKWRRISRINMSGKIHDGYCRWIKENDIFRSRWLMRADEARSIISA